MTILYRYITVRTEGGTFWPRGRREREFAPSSCGCSRMLRIPKHSASTLWPRTGRGTYSPWLPASSYRCRCGFAAWLSGRKLRDSKHSSDAAGRWCKFPLPAVFWLALHEIFRVLYCVNLAEPDYRTGPGEICLTQALCLSSTP